MRSRVTPADYSILVSDDEESIRRMLHTALSDWGFSVQTVASGEEVLTQIRAGKTPHIILTDLRMGGMTGIDLAAQAKEISNEIEVIIMTAQGTFETAVRASRSGVFDFICKPFDDLDDIRAILLHVCDRIRLRRLSDSLLTELRRKNVEIASLAQMSHELARTRDLASIVQIGCRGLSRAFADCPVAFLRYVQSQGVLMGAARHPDGLFGDTRPVVQLPGECATDPGRLVEFFQNLEPEPGFAGQLREAQRQSDPSLTLGAAGRWKAISLIAGEAPRGVFILHAEIWDEVESRRLADRYRDVLATAFENALSHALLLESSIRDGLTGLFNVQHLRYRLGNEINRATRLGHPISILFLDVDHFKKYNDTNGHPAGDRILQMLAKFLMRSFRSSDICARYGGEEFCVVLPDASLPDAAQKAERLRVEFERTPFPLGETQPLGKVTVSIGVAEYPGSAGGAAALIEAADVALYEAKRRSRNVVVIARPPVDYTPAYTAKAVRSTPAGSSQAG